MAAAAIAVPVHECTFESHEATKAELGPFLAGVINLRPWPGLGLMGECPRCPPGKPSTLIHSIDDDEAAAVLAAVTNPESKERTECHS